jgi:hypothetical protein
MKRVQFFALSVGFVVFCCLLPVNAKQQAQQAPAASAAAQQHAAPQHLGLLLGGKVLVRHGHYVFYNTDTHSTFRIENPAKAKAFKGDAVRIQGKVNARRHTIYIYKITSIM